MTTPADNQPKSPGPPWRLALVDADVTLHRPVREFFTALDHCWQVDTYANGAEAEKGFAAALPHVVLMDVFPPAGGELDRFRALRTRWPSLPVVLFTAPTQPELLREVLFAGAAGCLIKPQPLPELHAHLTEVLNRKLAICEKAKLGVHDRESARRRFLERAAQAWPVIAHFSDSHLGTTSPKWARLNDEVWWSPAAIIGLRHDRATNAFDCDSMPALAGSFWFKNWNVGQL